MTKLLFTKSVFPQNLVKIGETVWKLESVFEIQGSFGGGPKHKLEKISLTGSSLRKYASFKLQRV